jgi:tetratricopeptide (TPR) repeat protein
MNLVSLIRALRASGFAIEAEELADIIWLANQLPATKKRKPKDKIELLSQGQQPQGNVSASLLDIDQLQKQKTTDGIIQKPVRTKDSPARAGVYVPPGLNKSISGLSFSAGGVSALPNKLTFARALRPLLRQMPSRHHFELDEEATVHRIADTQVWLPVMRPNLTHWLELDVIVDEWPSIALWRESISELITLLTNLGAFRSIQTWSLWTNEDGKKIEFHNGWGATAEKEPDRPLKELVSVRENRLVLVLSDVISPAWYNGTIAQVFENWIRSEMVILFHLLPYQYWNRTGLINAIPAYFQSKIPGQSNSRLSAIPAPGGNKRLPKSGFLPLPVLPFDPQLIASWAYAVSGRNNLWIPGVMLPLNDEREQIRQQRKQAEQELSKPVVALDEYSMALAAVRRFQKSATPEAWKLAGYLSAAVPLSLPLMRLVQKVMLPESNREHLAEFYLSGLIQREKSSNYLSDEGARYEFVPGARRVLLSSISRLEAAEVIRRTSQFISRESGKVIDFNALVADPTLALQVNPEATPFAELSQNVLRILGGEYAILADALAGQVMTEEIEDSEQTGKDESNNTAQTTQEPETSIHVVKLNESLFSIALHYNISVETLIELNPSILFAGQQLSIPDSPDSIFYTVNANDNLSSIALRFKTTVNAILEDNPQITNPDLISVGQILKLSKEKPVSYTVSNGDTLRTIADRFGVAPVNILTLNPELIRVGQELVIPAPSIVQSSDKRQQSDDTRNSESARDVNDIRLETGLSISERAHALEKEATNFVEERKFDEGIAFYQQSIELFDKIGDRSGQSNVLDALAFAYSQQHRFEDAIQTYEAAIALDREINDRDAERFALNNLGLTYIQLGELNKAVEFCKQALMINRELGDKQQEANSLNNIGYVYEKTDAPHNAIEYYEQALILERELGNSQNEAYILINLGNVYSVLNESYKAIEFFELALSINRAVADGTSEARTLRYLGNELLKIGDFAKSQEFLRESKSISEKLDDKVNLEETLNLLAKVNKRLNQSNTYSPSPELSILRIYDQAQRVISAGFLVDDMRVITCAHVIQDALGSSQEIKLSAQLTVKVDFPLLPQQKTYFARVVFLDYEKDIAGLELTSDPPVGAQPVRLVIPDQELWGHTFRTLGFPSSYDDGVWASGVLRGKNAGGWIQIEDTKNIGHNVRSGFSGAPVWDEELEAVVGMVILADKNQNAETAFCIPSSMLMSWDVLKIEVEPSPKKAHLFISYRQGVRPEQEIADFLEKNLSTQGYIVFTTDTTIRTGGKSLERIGEELAKSDFLVVFISEASVASEMMQSEIIRAYELRKKNGHPQVLPIRVSYDALLPYSISAFLNPLQYIVWNDDSDNERVAKEVIQAMQGQLPAKSPHEINNVASEENISKSVTEFDARILDELQMPGGTVRLQDKFYIERDEDRRLRSEMKRMGTTITIHAPRQSGKSSLLIRGLEQAKQAGANRMLLDMQRVDKDHLASFDAFLRYFAEFVVFKLSQDADVIDRHWRRSLSPQEKLTNLFEDFIFDKVDRNLVICLDEIDDLLQTSFYSEFFGLLRSWHNLRAIDERWDKLSTIMVLSTEPYLLISNFHQSPFNVGVNLYLQDFNVSQIQDLNERHGTPLSGKEFDELVQIFGGHPFLTRKALYLLVAEKQSWKDLKAIAAEEHGPFGDHLRRYQWIIQQDTSLRDAFRNIIKHNKCSDDMLHRLLQGGLVKASGDFVRCRCDLYRMYFESRL